MIEQLLKFVRWVFIGGARPHRAREVDSTGVARFLRETGYTPAARYRKPAHPAVNNCELDVHESLNGTHCYRCGVPLRST